jgi:hypothetical protein
MSIPFHFGSSKTKINQSISIGFCFKSANIILIECASKIQSSITRFKPVLDSEFGSNSITQLLAGISGK